MMDVSSFALLALLTLAAHTITSTVSRYFYNLRAAAAAAAPPSNAAGATFQTVFSSLLPLSNALCGTRIPTDLV